jgi:V-type H+-transporting ATPase subunit d
MHYLLAYSCLVSSRSLVRPCSYEYMIDNILDLIKAATAASTGGSSAGSSTVDVNALMENCHPLGMLDESVMRSILAFENLAEDFHALYRTVLVDTPVGKYFTQFLREIAAEGDKAAADIDHVRQTFSEIPMPIIENSIKKYYLEDFYRFCVEEVGEETGELMGEVLATRADILAINITVNSLHSDFSRATTRTTRNALFPAIGHLYPEGVSRLASCEDEESIGKVLTEAWPEYGKLWASAPTDAVSNFEREKQRKR